MITFTISKKSLLLFGVIVLALFAAAVAMFAVSSGGQAAAAVLAPQTIVLTSGSSWTVPSDWNSSNNTVEVYGAGGGGGGGSGGSNSGLAGGGGGGGGYAKGANVVLVPGAQVVISVGTSGAGGVGGSGAGTRGTAGGSTIFNGSLQAAGGAGGGISNQAGGAGGAGTGGSVNAVGGAGAGAQGGGGTGGAGGGIGGGPGTNNGANGGGGGGGGAGPHGGAAGNGGSGAVSGPPSGSGAAGAGYGGGGGGGGGTNSGTGTSGGSGASGAIIITYTPVPPAPVASFTSSCSNLACAFANTSTDAGGNITTYAWNFGDGSISSAASPTHTYSADGTYTVSLTVTDDNSQSGSAASTVAVASSTNSSSGSTPIPSNTVLGNAAASTAQPSALPVPSCSGVGQVLQWVTFGGFACGTAASSGAPADGQVSVRFVNGAWTAYKQDGTVLNTAGSQTHGIQEAINYGFGNGLPVVVYGQGSSNPFNFSNVSLTFPAGFGNSFECRSCALTFNNAAQPGLVFDTQQAAHMEFTGQLFYSGSGAAVLLQPKIASRGVVWSYDSDYDLGYMTALGGSPIALIEVDATQTSGASQVNDSGFVTNTVTFNAECAGFAQNGVYIPSVPNAGQVAGENTFRFGDVEGCTSAEIAVGTMTGNSNDTNLGTNIYTGNLAHTASSSSGATIKSDSFGDQMTLTSANIYNPGPQYAIELGPHSSKNYIRVQQIIGGSSGAVQDQGSGNTVVGY